MTTLPSSDPRRRVRSRVALTASLLTHATLVALVLWRPELLATTPDALPLKGPAVPTRGGGGGGDGGVAMRYIALAPPAPVSVPVVVPPPPPPPPPPPVEPPVTIAPPEPPPPSAAVRDSLRADSLARGGGGGAAGVGPGSGGGSGGGSGTGRGTGVGGGEGPGTGGDGGLARAPEPRQMIIPPEFPRAMRGQRIAVHFWVSAEGRVERVAFEPEVPDRGYARRLEEVMKDYRFRPARDARGQQVAGTTRVILTF